MDHYPGDPSGSGAQVEQGLSDVLDPHPFGRTHMEKELETDMDLDETGDPELMRLHSLLQGARSQLTEALEEANELQAKASWSGSEDEEGGSRGLTKNSDDLAENLASMSNREREAAIKRARNREAARRSRQRKNERINQLYKEIRSLQHENVVLLKCIEEFTQKAITSKAAQLEMKQELEALATDPGYTTMTPTEPSIGIALAPTTTTSALRSRGSPKGAISIPALEDLHKLQNAEPAQLTARSGTLSARAAVAEHMAMLSRDNSPRDEDVAAGAGGTAAGAGAGGAATTHNNALGAPSGSKESAKMVPIDALMQQQQIPMDTTTHAAHAMLPHAVLPQADGLIAVEQLFAREWGNGRP